MSLQLPILDEVAEHLQRPLGLRSCDHVARITDGREGEAVIFSCPSAHLLSVGIGEPLVGVVDDGAVQRMKPLAGASEWNDGILIAGEDQNLHVGLHQLLVDVQD